MKTMTENYEARLVEIARTIRREHKDLLIPADLNAVPSVVRFTSDINFLLGYILALDPLPVTLEDNEK